MDFTEHFYNLAKQPFENAAKSWLGSYCLCLWWTETKKKTVRQTKHLHISGTSFHISRLVLLNFGWNFVEYYAESALNIFEQFSVLFSMGGKLSFCPIKNKQKYLYRPDWWVYWVIFFCFFTIQQTELCTSLIFTFFTSSIQSKFKLSRL